LKEIKIPETARILITGGAGFIGSNVAERLIANNEIIILDNLTTGKIETIKSLKARGKLKFIKGDIKDLGLVRNCSRDVDYVLHFAAIVGVDYASSNPIEVLDTELAGISNILKASLENDVKRIIYASSSEVYGESANEILSEDITLSPRSIYGTAKMTAELYCKSYYAEFGLESVCLRYFNVYGPRQDARFVVAQFIKQALNGLNITVYYNGEQTRDFTYIEDAVNATIISIMGNVAGQSINVGAGKPIQIRKLAELISKMCSKKNQSKILYTSPSTRRLPEFEVKHRCADISKMQRLLNYTPSTNLNEGLGKTTDWYAKHSSSKL